MASIETLSTLKLTGKELPLNNYISTEASFSIINCSKDEKVAKIFLPNTEAEIMDNKLKTIENLISLGEKSDIKDYLILPEKIVVDEKENFVGYIMPFCNGVNLKQVLKNPLVDKKNKIDLLKNVGQILENMAKLRNEGICPDFYLDDLHENNIMVTGNSKLYVVDSDSIKINYNEPSPSRYLRPFSAIEGLKSKYKRYESFDFGDFLPDQNTDLYCYIMMIVNTLLGKDEFAHTLSKNQYFSFMNYLYEIGVPLSMVELLSKVYKFDNNVNPLPILDSLIPFINNDKVKFGMIKEKVIR